MIQCYCTTFPLPRSKFGSIIKILKVCCLKSTKFLMKTIKIGNIRILNFKNLIGPTLENTLTLCKYFMPWVWYLFLHILLTIFMYFSRYTCISNWIVVYYYYSLDTEEHSKQFKSFVLSSKVWKNCTIWFSYLKITFKPTILL